MCFVGNENAEVFVVTAGLIATGLIATGLVVAASVGRGKGSLQVRYLEGWGIADGPWLIADSPWLIAYGPQPSAIGYSL